MNEEINKLIEKFEKRLQEVKEKYKKPEPELRLTENYWYINSAGRVFLDFWGNTSSEHKMYEIGNVFKTPDEASFEVEKRKVLHELKQLGRPFRTNESNFSICLRHDSRDNQKRLFYKAMIEVDHAYGDYYFDSLPKAKDAVYRIGEERIMKYLFRAED